MATRVCSPQPPAPESALLTPPREGHPDDATEETPTPSEAARRLTRFLDEVRVEREPPLIASPPRQKMPVRRPPTIRPRRSRIAAQTVGAHSSLLTGRGSPQLERVSHRRPHRFRLRQGGYSTPCVLESWSRPRWRPWTRCSPRATGSHASSSRRTHRARRGASFG
jgi:hypothetical protein